MVDTAFPAGEAGDSEVRVIFRLRARRDAEYPREYHDNLRGIIWNALEDTRHDSAHNDGTPVGVSISNVFPWSKTIDEGDIRRLIVASPHEDALSAIVRNHNEGDELNIGELPFDIVGVSPYEPDVGEPGTEGVLETSTGVYTRLSPELCDTYGIEYDSNEDGDEFWSSESNHPLGAFTDYLEQNLQLKHDLFHFPHLDGPADVDEELFESHELIKEYAIHLPVAGDHSITAILTKWRLGYRVRDDAHRRHLNLALDTGLGGRNTLGLGFVNRQADLNGVPQDEAVGERQ